MEPSGPPKRLRLRRPDRCARCGHEFTPGDEALWYRDARVVTCLVCLPVTDRRTTGKTESEVAAEPEVLAGTAGASARREYDHRRQKREDRARERLGRL